MRSAFWNDLAWKISVLCQFNLNVGYSWENIALQQLVKNLLKKRFIYYFGINWVYYFSPSNYCFHEIHFVARAYYKQQFNSISTAVNNGKNNRKTQANKILRSENIAEKYTYLIKHFSV